MVSFSLDMARFILYSVTLGWVNSSSKSALVADCWYLQYDGLEGISSQPHHSDSTQGPWSSLFSSSSTVKVKGTQPRAKDFKKPCHQVEGFNWVGHRDIHMPCKDVTLDSSLSSHLNKQIYYSFGPNLLQLCTSLARGFKIVLMACANQPANEDIPCPSCERPLSNAMCCPSGSL